MVRQKPDSLVTRIFKSRYFPDNHILQASKGNDSSFIWTGIWEAKESLKGGFRWVLGDGKEIKIFKDPWLQGKVDYRVEDHHLNVIRNENVCCYFHPNSKFWDVHKVEHDFHNDDRKLILQTRIPQIEAKDRLAWTSSSKGTYTVKSGYLFWAAQHINNDNNVESQECWLKAGLSFDMQNVEYASSWLLDMFSTEDAEVLQKMAIVLSGIWFSRNRKVWEGKIITPAVAIDLSGKQVRDWQEANSRRHSDNDHSAASNVVSRVVWQPPPPGHFKLNVDAALHKGEGQFALGLILRNDAGVFVKGKNMKVAGEVSVMEAEARGVLEAIKWVEDSGIQCVIVESDSLLVVQALKSTETYQLEVGHILDEWKIKLKSRADLSVCHVKKQANRAAHLMAKVPCLLNCSNCFTSPPGLLVEILSAEFAV
ncbi:uncharacterized protein LOC135151500 [Daucus carota subsp. sativus]|uniref:uncharacterized protein LOC135151500 n=1 Tax=Daucus carota subsp. sativus TaxID=79200 RepID=UPI00308278E8